MSRRKAKKKNRSKFQDGISASGMGTSCDNTTSMRPGRAFPSYLYGNQNTPFGQMGAQVDQFWLNLYRAHWEAKKIVDIPPGDMTREGWEWKSDSTSPEQLKEIKEAEEELGFPKEIAKALVYERLYGGGLVFLGLKEQENTKPLDPVDVDKIGTDDLVFVRAIPSFQVNSSDIENNPLSPNYKRPEWYTINGVQVHRSRFLIFDGIPLDEPFFGQNGHISHNNKLGFGESALLCLYKEVQDAQGARQSVSHLIHKLSVAIFKKKGIKTLKTTKRGNEILEELEDITQMMSNFRGILIDADDEVVNYSSNANAGEGLIVAFLQVLSAASDIPATRFLGQAPGGLNATGDSDLRNYYDRISADQNNRLKLPLIYAGQILSRSVLGKETNGLYVEFNPLWQMTEKEQAEIRQLNASTLASLEQFLDDDELRQEITERKITLNELKKRPEPEPLNLGLGNIKSTVPGKEGDVEIPGEDEVDTGDEEKD